MSTRRLFLGWAAAAGVGTRAQAGSSAESPFRQVHHGFAYYQITLATRYAKPHPEWRVALQNRVIMHLLHYPMTRRAPDIDIIEDPGILLEQMIQLRLDMPPERVELVSQRRLLPLQCEDGCAVTTVDRVLGHQAISFES